MPGVLDWIMEQITGQNPQQAQATQSPVALATRNNTQIGAASAAPPPQPVASQPAPTEPPPPEDVSPFWRGVSRAVGGLGPIGAGISGVIEGNRQDLATHGVNPYAYDFNKKKLEADTAQYNYDHRGDTEVGNNTGIKYDINDPSKVYAPGEKAYDALDAYTKATAKAKNDGTGEALSPEAVESALTAWSQGDPSLIQGFARNKLAKVQIANAMTPFMLAHGMKMSDIIAAKTALGGDMAEIRALGGRIANIDTAVEEVKVQSKLAMTASAAVPRGKFIPINTLWQMADRQISDPGLKALKGYSLSVANAAAVAAGRGTTNVELQREYREYLGTADSPEAYSAAITTILNDADAVSQSSDTVRDTLLDRVRARGGFVPPKLDHGAAAAPPAAPAAPAKPLVALPPTGQAVKLPGGGSYTVVKPSAEHAPAGFMNGLRAGTASAPARVAPTPTPAPVVIPSGGVGGPMMASPQEAQAPASIPGDLPPLESSDFAPQGARIANTPATSLLDTPSSALVAASRGSARGKAFNENANGLRALIKELSTSKDPKRKAAIAAILRSQGIMSPQ